MQFHFTMNHVKKNERENMSYSTACRRRSNIKRLVENYACLCSNEIDIISNIRWKIEKSDFLAK